MDRADLLVRHLDEDARDRLVIGCVEEIVAFENAKSDNLLKVGEPTDTKLLRELERVLSRVGYGISGKNVFPLSLQLDLETVSLPMGVGEAIAEALGRYRDGKYAGAISGVLNVQDRYSLPLSAFP